jgi:hypothetical protein
MDSDREWEPIIGEIPVDYAEGKVTYDGYSLHINGHQYCDYVARYLPHTTPKLTKAGRIAARQPAPPEKQPLTWWKAQCIFRGLPSKGTIAKLQEQLRGHAADPVLNVFHDLKERAKKEFKAKNNAAVEHEWIHEMSPDEKSRTDPRRYLEEVFAASGPCPDTVVMKGDDSSGKQYALWVQNLAKELSLEAEVVEGPQIPDVYLILIPWWVVVGRKKAAVSEKTQEILKETEKEKKRRQEKAQAIQMQKEAALKKKADDLKAALGKCKDWDVTGTYLISCPEIEDNYTGSVGEQLNLKVYLQKTPKGPQMFAKFNFSILTGVFRFERHPAVTKGNPSNQITATKRKREYDSDDEDEDRDRSPTPDMFYLGTVSQPSEECQSWNYRWRGEETWESVIELGSDEKPYSVKWFGPRVTKLEGTFGSDMLKDCKFTGIKIGVGSELEKIDIAEEWANRNESGYEYARRARW